MNKFIKKILLFTLPLLILLLIKKGFVNHKWESPKFAQKSTYFQKNKGIFNTVFFGSSRICRQINPAVLDSVAAEKNIHSYNFGTTATYNPESYFLYEKFVKTIEKNKLKYAIIEVQDIKFSTENASTTKGSYWNTFSYLLYSTRYVLYSDKSLPFKFYQILILLKGFSYSLVDFNPVIEKISRKQAAGLNKYGETNGYFPYDRILDNPDEKKLRQRWETYHSDTTKLVKRIAAAKRTHFPEKGGRFNIAHYEKLVELLKLSKEKNIHVFFLLPPRLVEGSYSELVPVMNQLPQKNVISMYNSSEFSEFYMTENSFDIGHLNAKGSDVFTSHLGSFILLKSDNS